MFISNTACLKDDKGFLKPIMAVARYFKFAPYVAFISREELLSAHEQCGFEIDHYWTPPNSQDVCFIVAIKPAYSSQ